MAITFKRNLSSFLVNLFATAAARNERVYNTHIAADFTLQDNTHLRYATGELVIDSISQDGASVAITPLSFVARLSGAPDIRYGSGSTTDAGEFQVVNLDYVITSAVPGVSRIFDNCKVRVYVAFPKPDGNYEGVIYFDGLLREVGGDDADAGLQVIHDLSSRASTVGYQIPQRCLNELGDDWCGVGYLPVGAECSKDWSDAVAGCAYWGGVFNGVPFISNSDFNPNRGDIGWDGDPPIPPRDCPCAETTVFPSANGGIIHARDLKAGEVIFDPEYNPVTVEYCERKHVNYRYAIETKYGAKLISSATHKLLRTAGDMAGKSCTSWNFTKDGILCATPKGILVAESVPVVEEKNFNYHFRPLKGGTILSLVVGGSHRYWAGMEADYYIGNHNLKDDYPFPI